MNRIRAIFAILFSAHFMVYTRSGRSSWMHHRELGLGDTMRIIEGANEIEEDLIQMDENIITTLQIASGE